MQETHVFDLLPAYALGCLDEEDLLTVARHLPACPVCRKELEGYLVTVDQIPLALPLEAPAPDLKERVLLRVGGLEAESTTKEETNKAKKVDLPVDEKMGRSGFLEGLLSLFGRKPGFALGALALMILIIALLGANTLMLGQRVNQLMARIPADDMHLVELNGTDKAPQAAGYLMVFKDESYGALVVKDAPALDPDHQYQIWLIKDGKRSNGGVFSVDTDGYAVYEVSAAEPLVNYQNFGITVEPAGGSPGPTGQKVLGGGL